MSRTAVIHVRVSSQKQADKELPVESQLARCEALAERLGASVIAEFAEEGVSGWQGPRREFDAAIEFCEKHHPDYFITWSTSRFSRSQERAIVARARLERAGTRLVYVSFDPGEDANTRFLNIAFREVMDEYFSREVSSNTRRSMYHNAEQGFFNGGPVPFGYGALPAPDNVKRRRLYVVEPEAAVVRDIFRRRLEGDGALTIAKRLNEAHSTCRGRRWTKSSVTMLLRSASVIGAQVFGKRPRPLRILVPRDQWTIVQSHQAIVEREVWDRVQEMMDASDTKKGNSSAQSLHLFTGVLACGRCGASLQIETATGRGGKLYSYYNCRSAQKKGTCEHRRLRADELDDFLIDQVAERVFSRRNVLQLMKDMRSAIGRYSVDKQRVLDDLDVQILELERKQRRIIAMIEDDDLANVDTRWLMTTGSEQEKRLNLLRQQRERAVEEPDPQLDISDKDAEEFRQFLIDVIRYPKQPKKIRNFLRQVLERIVIEDALVRIFYHPSVILSTAEGFAVGKDGLDARFAASASRLPETVLQSDEISEDSSKWLPGTGQLRTRCIVVPLPERWHRKAA